MYTYPVCTVKSNGEFVLREYGTVSPRSPRHVLVMPYSSRSEERDQTNLGMAAADRMDIIIQRTQLIRKLRSEKKCSWDFIVISPALHQRAYSRIHHPLRYHTVSGTYQVQVNLTPDGTLHFQPSAFSGSELGRYYMPQAATAQGVNFKLQYAPAFKTFFVMLRNPYFRNCM